MGISDPIADFLTRIRNAKEAEHRFVDVSYSKVNVGILKVLQEEGYIEKFLVRRELYQIRVFLRYNKSRLCAIQKLKRVSKPGVRKYLSQRKIPKVFGGLGLAILSTSKGIVSGERAKELGVGGEHLCNLW